MTFLQKNKRRGRKNCRRKGNNFADEKGQRKPGTSLTGQPRFPERSRKPLNTIEANMLETIRVQSARGDIERYKELLGSDWSRETLDDVLALLGKIVAKGVNRPRSPGRMCWFLLRLRNPRKISSRGSLTASATWPAFSRSLPFPRWPNTSPRIDQAGLRLRPSKPGLL